MRLKGPADRAPETGRDDEAGERSEEHSDSEDSEDKLHDVPGDSAAEASIAVDPIHDVKPVKMMQALQGTLEALNTHAATILRNEKKAQIATKDGVLQPVPDEGAESACSL